MKLKNGFVVREVAGKTVDPYEANLIRIAFCFIV